VYILNHTISFPPAHFADADGLLAIGGDLSTERLLHAYKHGIFPWYNEDEPIMWWHPNPRFVLYPNELKISKSMKPILRNGVFQFTFNQQFSAVIHHCKQINRPQQDGTWIQTDIIDAYTKLHTLGYAISAECWQNGELVGGLYGVLLGTVFFGESMFSNVSNASKFAFINLVKLLESKGVKLIDCQIHSPHLESLGARFIERELFLSMLQKEIA
jgi:leucyl/phenylalanyl-tRNA--protein transferase